MRRNKHTNRIDDFLRLRYDEEKNKLYIEFVARQQFSNAEIRHKKSISKSSISYLAKWLLDVQKTMDEK